MSCCVILIHSALGYEIGATLRGAPYDLRLVGDRCYTESYFSILKALVEDTVQQNNGRRVRFVCHSLGCMLGCVMNMCCSSVLCVFITHPSTHPGEWCMMQQHCDAHVIGLMNTQY